MAYWPFLLVDQGRSTASADLTRQLLRSTRSPFTRCPEIAWLKYFKMRYFHWPGMNQFLVSLLSWCLGKKKKKGFSLKGKGFTLGTNLLPSGSWAPMSAHQFRHRHLWFCRLEFFCFMEWLRTVSVVELKFCFPELPFTREICVQDLPGSWKATATL